ncbi:YjjI family glycine radical enzyme [Hungatella hominis]|uniref:YjjI family glycine radical enzyme n=1 Tax=Hungatella hominis TaxID=2763050 RepID=A0ABR7HB42_9FIRM|nr:YjjI family glycine radical enzyme [Hungatella hominis]MBC5710424.1 YjjI family glycine radical enzyme [Hungatella hominis]
MNKVLDIVTSKGLTYEQKVVALAHAAENSLEVLEIPEKTRHYMETGAICDLDEGHAPYRPRYIMPDYEAAIKKGCEFLQLDPPKDLDEVIQFLEILYRHVPSITSYPVYLGSIDRLIEPFLEGVSDEEAEKKLRLFLIYLDRTITDGFCHANLGPEETRTGRIILKLEKELQNAVPNLTLKYDPDITPDSYGELALYTSLYCANPAICNHRMHKDTYGDYGISSCYNILPIGGGSYTLTRIVLPKLVPEAESREQFLTEVLPDCLQRMGDYMNERIRFLVEESNFFETSFLSREGFISRDKFLAMFGVVGLAECTNLLMDDPDKIYGSDQEADQLADQIMQVIAEYAETSKALYSEVFHGHFALHAQVGIDSDHGITSGVRIPVGMEPERMYDHLRHSARFHRFFPTGCADIFSFDPTGRNNPAAMLDIVKGAFSLGDKYISFYASDSDLVRITGYLVKRSEMEKYYEGEAVLQNTVYLGGDNYRNAHLENRKVRAL